MRTKNNQPIVIALGLLFAIVLTRTNHFGDHVYLPDATLAVLFLGGLLVARKAWLGLAIAVAFGMDFYALGWNGVSDFCISLGYWGLIPTYAVVWGAGRLLAKNSFFKQAQNPFNISPFVLFALASTSIAFVMSNAFWYLFSDKVATLSIVEFSERVAQYYIPYVGCTMLYLGVAWVTHRTFASIRAQITLKSE